MVIYETINLPMGVRENRLTHDIHLRYGERATYSVLWDTFVADTDGEWFSITLEIYDNRAYAASDSGDKKA
jgi:hypothetical protein